MTEARAVVYEKPFEFAIRKVQLPSLGSGQALIRPTLTGVCASDLHLHAGGFWPAYPLTPGHEIVGVVEEVAADVDGLLPGRQVVVDNLHPCGRCTFCAEGRGNLCKDLAALGVSRPGGFAEYVVADAGNCLVVDDLDADLAVLAEPTACGVHATDLVGLDHGADVLVFGAGPSGLILAQLLKAAGARRVTVAAPTAFKLEVARGLGIDETVQLSRADPTVGEEQLRGIAPEGFDAVVDATGALGVLERCVAHTRSGGTILLYGVTSMDAAWSVSPFEIFGRQLTIKGSMAQNGSFDRALEALRTGAVRPDGIVTHRFALEDFGAALAATESDPGCLKALVVP